MFVKFPNITIAIIIAVLFIGGAVYFSNIGAIWHKSLISIFGGSDSAKEKVLVGAGNSDIYL